MNQIEEMNRQASCGDSHCRGNGIRPQLTWHIPGLESPFNSLAGREAKFSECFVMFAGGPPIAAEGPAL